VAAIRAGLAEVSGDVVLLLAGDLPFLTVGLLTGLRERLTGDGVLVVDETGRDQYLLGAWRTAALRSAVAAAPGHTSLRRMLAPIPVRRWSPGVVSGEPPPWLDCDTPADLARARRLAGEPGGDRPPPSTLLPRFQAPRGPR
jgi:molybdopterin-guanine dinucleotide biosynthesis protein A